MSSLDGICSKKYIHLLVISSLPGNESIMLISSQSTFSRSSSGLEFPSSKLSSLHIQHTEILITQILICMSASYNMKTVFGVVSILNVE